MDLAHNSQISRVLSPQKIGLQSEQPKATGKLQGGEAGGVGAGLAV